MIKYRSAEDPHSGLGIADPLKEEQGHGDGEDEVPHFMFEAHCPGIADGKAGGVEEIDFEMQEGFEEIGDGVGGIAMIAVESDDDVAGGVCEASAVGAAITSDFFSDDISAEASGDFRGAVSGAVVDDDSLIDEVRHTAQDLFDALFFIQAGNDDRDALIFVHASARTSNCKGSPGVGLSWKM